MPETLVVVASEREGSGLVEAHGLRRVEDFRLKAGSHEAGLGLYRGEFCSVLITGVLEHHMVAATALALQAIDVDHVVNFGACGTYGNRFGATSAPAIGDTVGVSLSYRFDVDDNGHWAPPRRLDVADASLPAVACVSGSRYSRDHDYETGFFPMDGNVEDMELYGLSVLMQTLDRPLYSVKYVVNEVGPSGREQFRANVVSVRASAERALEKCILALAATTTLRPMPDASTT